MSSGRQAMAALILSQKALVNGTLIDPDGPEFHGLRDRLSHAGLRAGEVVVLNGLEGRDLVIAALAVWQSDAVAMPSAGNSPPHVLCDACRITQQLAVVPASLPRRIEGLAATTAVLHMSSGSTDRPKVAKRGVDSMLMEAEGYRVGLSLAPDDCVAVPIPLTHSLGWGVAISALICGCGVDVEPLVRPNSLARKIDSGSVSVVALTAPLARLLIGTRRQGEARLRAAMVGAGPVSDQLDDTFKERFGTPLLRGYGSSETGGTFIGDKGIGKPIRGVEITRPPPGDRGELFLRLAAPVEGYLDGPSGPSTEWRTGDVVRRDLDGVVYFIERARGPLRLNGRFIQADVIEKTLQSIPGVEDVYLLVLPRREAPDTEDFYAVLEGDPPSDEAVARALAAHAAETPVPRVLSCARLPRNALGKPDRPALVDMVRKGNGHA